MSKKIDFLSKIRRSYFIKHFLGRSIVKYSIFQVGILNFIHNRMALKKISTLDYCLPEVFHLETTNFCNARCIMCAHSNMKRTKGFMGEDLFKKISQDAHDVGIEKINMQFYGEPFLDKNIFEKIRHLKSLNFWVTFNTNAALLDENCAKQLLESGLDELLISIDAFDAKVFESIRVGLNYKIVKENIERLILFKKQNRSDLPIRLTYILMPQNEHQVKDFISYWKNKVEAIEVSFLRDWAGQKDSQHSKSAHLGKKLPVKNPCISLWKDMVVMYDGKVALCCEDYNGKVVMGDLTAQSIKEVWFGEKFKSYRQAHLDNRRNVMKLCSNCRKFSLWI